MARKKRKNRGSHATKANYRPKVKPEVKEALYREAGYKCANPGCYNTLLDLHHIDQWHVYQTHDRTAMIAICPTCHGHVHRGKNRIDDAKIRRWKMKMALRVEEGQISILPRTHIWVAPAQQCSLLLGTLRFATTPDNTTGSIIFNLAANNALGFRVHDNEFLRVTLRITDTSGQDVLRIADNEVTCPALPPVIFESRTGWCRVTAPVTPEYIPSWVVEKYSVCEDALFQNGAFTVLEIEVLAAGVVKVQGVWYDNEKAVIITRDRLAICRPPQTGFMVLQGYYEVRGDLVGDECGLNHTPIIVSGSDITFPVLEDLLVPLSGRSGQ